METKLITCPETGHLEEIGVERTPCGVLVASCSRFVPADHVPCGAECARRLDTRDRAARDDWSERVLVVGADMLITRPLAERLVSELRQDGLVAELADADSGSVPPPADYDAVVIGCASPPRRLPRSLLRYVAEYREMLSSMPSFLFSIGNLSAHDVGSIAERTGWLPRYTAAFALGKPDPSAVHLFALTIGETVPSELV
jgi:hypothetical protein